MISAFGIEHGTFSKSAAATGGYLKRINAYGGKFRHTMPNNHAKRELAEHFMQTGQKDLKMRTLKIAPHNAKLRMVP